MATVEQIELRQRVRAHIQEHPEEHEQRTLAKKSKRARCGTTMCVAGTALAFAGLLEYPAPKHGVSWGDVPFYKRQEFFVLDLGEEWSWADPWSYWAAQALGLDAAEALDLFFEWNNARAFSKLKLLCLEPVE